MSSRTYFNNQVTGSPSKPTKEVCIVKLHQELADLTDSIQIRDQILELPFQDRAYCIKAAQHKRNHQAYFRQVEEFGAQASEAQFERWERQVEELRQWTLNYSEQLAERGMLRRGGTPDVFPQDWTFEGAWGRVSAMDDNSVDPLTTV